MIKYVRKYLWFNGILFLILLIVLSSWLISHNSLAGDNDLDNDGIPDEKETELALRHAPYLHFATGEKFFPVDVSYHVDNSDLFLKSSADTNILVDSSPTIASISIYKEGSYFLNNTLGGVDEIAQDYSQKRESLGYTIYARVAKSMQYYVMQYWFFYVFNLGTLN